MTNYTRKALEGSTINFLMSFIASVIAYATTIFLTRRLSIADFGLFSAVFEFLSFFFFFRELGLNSGIVKYIIEHKVTEAYHRIKTAILVTATIQFLSSLLLVGGFYLFSGYLTNSYFKSLIAWKILEILFIYLFFSILFRIIKSVFQAFQRMTLYAVVEPLKNLLTLICIIIFTELEWGVYAPAWSYVLSSALLVLILVPFFLKTINLFKYKSIEVPQVSRSLIFISLPFLVNGISSRVIASFDTLMLTKMKTLVEVGVYNAILPTSLILLFFSQSISAVIFPLVAELWVRKDFTRLKEGLRLLYKYFFVAVTPLFAVLIFYSNLFLKLVFGPGYVSGTLAFQILLIGVLLYTIAQINGSVIPAVTSPNTVTIITAIAAGVNVILNLLLIPHYGIEGAAFATAMSYLTASILSIYWVRKFISFKVPIYSWLKTGLALGTLIALMYSFNVFLHFNFWVNLIINLLASFIVYLILIYLFSLIDFKELKKYLALMIKKK